MQGGRTRFPSKRPAHPAERSTTTTEKESLDLERKKRCLVFCEFCLRPPLSFFSALKRQDGQHSKGLVYGLSGENSGPTRSLADPLGGPPLLIREESRSTLGRVLPCTTTRIFLHREKVLLHFVRQKKTEYRELRNLRIPVDRTHLPRPSCQRNGER